MLLHLYACWTQRTLGEAGEASQGLLWGQGRHSCRAGPQYPYPHPTHAWLSAAPASGLLGHKLEGGPREPLQRLAFALSVYLAGAWGQAEAAWKPQVSPPAGPPRPPATPQLQPKSRRGESEPATPFNVPAWLGPGQSPSWTRQPWGSLLPWALITELLPGSPQDHWGPSGQAGTVISGWVGHIQGPACLLPPGTLALSPLPNVTAPRRAV